MTAVDETVELVEPEIVGELPPSVGSVFDELTTKQCRYCDERFPLGRGGGLARGRHEKAHHYEEWQQDKSRADAEKPTAAAKVAKAGAKAKARAAGERKSAAELLSSGAAGLGWIMMSASANVPALGPMGAMVSFEAPIAGEELDTAFAGGLVDRIILQKALDAEDRFKRVGPLVMAPLIVGAMALYPQAFDEMVPFLKKAIQPMLPALVAEMRRQQEEAEETQALALELAELDPDFAELFADGGDPIDAIISRLFPQPPEPQAAPVVTDPE